MRIVLFLLFATFGASAETFTSTDVFEIEIAGDPRLSPDGKYIAYVRQSNDIMSDSTRSNIWIVDRNGEDHRPVLSGVDSYSSPRWSPDGSRLAYITGEEGRGAELYVRWMDSGQTALVSNLEASPRGISWSPDGKMIAYSAFVKGESASLAKPPRKPKDATWAPPVVVVESLDYRSDGRGLLEPGNTQIFVIPAEGGTPRQLTKGEFDHGGQLTWSPDGSTIVFSTNRNEDAERNPTNSDLWSVDVESGELTQMTFRQGPDFAPVFSPDGSRILYRGYDDRKMGYHNIGVYVLDVSSGESTALTSDFDRSIGRAEWAGSVRRIYAMYDDNGRRCIGLLTLNGKLDELACDVGGASVGRPYTSGGFSAGKNGEFVYSRGSEYRPADVALGNGKGYMRTLTSLNEDLLAHKELGSVEEARFRSTYDDLELQGWIIKPPGFDPDKKYPLMLEIHGGPFAAYGPHFTAELQLYAAAGYVVLYMNPRGSTSYGDAFANEIHHNYPSQDYDDLISGVDHVIEQGYVDPDALYVTGGSGGGVLSAWIVGKTNRFRAAAVQKPVINWTSHALYSDIPIGVADYWFGKMPWEDQENYWRRSPLSLVGNVTTPTMLITGEADQRTPMAESEQYYQALKLQGVESALVRIPDASHGIANRPSHLIAKVDNILAWFERYRREQSEE